MTHVTAPLIFAALVWWAATGVVLRFVRTPPSAHRAVAIGATIVAGLAMGALVLLRGETTHAGAYAGFIVGVALWSWHEVMFLLGFVGGPDRAPCPPNLPMGRRFVVSARALSHHELAIAAHGLAIAALSLGAENIVPMLTYFLLWAMRISAKLMVFFGAPNVSDSFLPRQLDYLKSFFRAKPSPVSLTLVMLFAALLAALVSWNAAIAAPGAFEATALMLLAALAGLALLEHVALVLPLPDAALWGWALKPAAPVPSTEDTAPKTDWRNE